MNDRQGWSDRGGLFGRGIIMEGDAPGTYKSIPEPEHDERAEFLKWVQESPSAQGRIAAGDTDFVQWVIEKLGDGITAPSTVPVEQRLKASSITNAAPDKVKLLMACYDVWAMRHFRRLGLCLRRRATRRYLQKTSPNKGQ